MIDTEILTPRMNPSLKGHEGSETVLLNAAQSGRLAHAWILCGPRGIGKATLAYRFARYLLTHGDAKASGLFGDAPASMSIDEEDPVFRRVASGGHSDLFTVEPTVNPSSKKLRTEIIVEDVRLASEFLRLTPGEGTWRVVIVDAADEMNHAAANAILKILEEPPKATVFLLVSHASGRLLPTIRSRCRVLTMQPLSRELVVEFLEDRQSELEEHERAMLSGLSGGSIGEAVALAEAGGLALYREMVKILGNIGSLNIEAVHSLGDRLARDNNSKAFETFTRMLSDWLSKLVRNAACGIPIEEIVPGETEAAAQFGGALCLAQNLLVWEKVTRLLNQADSSNFDRKQVVVNAFLTMQASVKL